jgi:hypothetical protein
MRASIVKLVFVTSEKYIPFSHVKVNNLLMFKKINNTTAIGKELKSLDTRTVS